MHPYVFKTDVYALRWENVLIMVGIFAGLWLAHRRAAPKGRAYQDMIVDLALWLVPAGVVGGRVWEVIWTWRDYAAQPLQALALWNGGMSIQGCVLGGLVAALVFGWRRQVRVWELLDVLAPGVLLGQAIGRIGCLTSGDAFGRPAAEVAWWPQWLAIVYHPESPAAWFYGATPLIPAEALEGLGDFLVLGLLLWYVPRREVPGRISMTYAILYSLIRFGLEFLRADSLLVGGLKVAQLLSIAAMLVCSVLLAMQYRRHTPTITKATGQ
ncbi:MAG TPA: prolipoprotein diacylglyceryl transferase [Symbiobacteriaceae bacterium]|nr:prolipoprotein diacylglyceryl transferase [Symbiobacteriaceae bacterium]